MPRTAEEDIAKAAELAEKVKDLRAQMNDPATQRREKPRIKLQIDTYTWLMARFDAARYGKKVKVHRNADFLDVLKGFPG